jgi:hypothetical protein
MLREQLGSWSGLTEKEIWTLCWALAYVNRRLRRNPDSLAWALGNAWAVFVGAKENTR